MSKGSGIRKRILSAGLAKCNPELDPESARSRTPSELGVDCRRKFCFHRQNLSGYFQNL